MAMWLAGRRAVTRRGHELAMGTLGPVITAVPPADVAQTEEAARVLGPLLGAGTVSLDGDGVVERVLALARVHLGLDISWFSRFEGDVHVLEHVSGDGARFHVGAGVENSGVRVVLLAGGGRRTAQRHPGCARG